MAKTIPEAPRLDILTALDTATDHIEKARKDLHKAEKDAAKHGAKSTAAHVNRLRTWLGLVSNELGSVPVPPATEAEPI